MILRSATALAALLFVSSCDPPGVSVTLDVPQDALDQAAWIEIAAFPKGACPPPSQLSGGLPQAGATARVSYKADDGPAGLGLLPSGSYGFAAVVRRDDCGVVAAGCVPKDVTRGGSVAVPLSLVDGPDASACASGAVCYLGRCVPPPPPDPAVGAACSMRLLAAGPLADPMDDGPLVSAPALAVTTAGFLVAYTEYQPGDGSMRLTIESLDDAGGILGATQQDVDGHCPSETTLDAVGVTLDSSGGLLVFARPPCQNRSGLELYSLDGDGNVLDRHTYLYNSPPEIGVSPHPVAPAAAGGKYLVVYRQNGASTMALTDGTSVTTQVTSAFGAPQDKGVQIARGATSLAVATLGKIDADAGGGDGARVFVLPQSPDPQDLGAPVDQPEGTLAALAALGGRALLLTNGTGQGQDEALRAYDVGQSGASYELGLVAADITGVEALDLAVAQDRAFAVIEQKDTLQISVVDGVGGSSPTELRDVRAADDPRVPRTFHDGPVAVLATDSKVLVAWTSRKSGLLPSDPAGGYALYACSK